MSDDRARREVRIKLADLAQDFVEAALDLLVAVENDDGLSYEISSAAEKLREIADSRQW